MKSILDIAIDARQASLELANISTQKKNEALLKLAEILIEKQDAILLSNKKDLDAAQANGLSKPMLERLALSPKKIQAIAEGVRQVASLPDPIGEIIEKSVRPNGMEITKVRVPIGVIGIIYESRPNVTVDCAILCLKSGNAAILRGGSEAFLTNMALAEAINDALVSTGINANCVQIIPTSDRSALNELLTLDEYIHCIIPRGGEGLIRFVVKNSTIPVLKHYKGVCTVFVDKSADIDIAEAIVINAKCQRPSVCNAAENLLVHSDCASLALPRIAKALIENNVEIKASERAAKILESNKIPFNLAVEKDFSTEYVDLIISVDIVDSVKNAVDFINKYGSGHSDAIVTADSTAAEQFLNSVDSSTVYWNVSTRFTDGFEFGLGAEIGISTDKLHARGPMGLRELCSYKYKVTAPNFLLRP